MERQQQEIVTGSVVLEAGAQAASEPFVGRWNRLVSTTNWEKGRIIHQWREALMAGGASATEFSDEAWSRLVAGVTPQHVGRLRRVYQRFGEVSSQYAGLYWSHFQAALDWDDAEMWLEGAIQNAWSISQMRGQRAETLGELRDEVPDADPVSLDMDEDLDREGGALAESAGEPVTAAAVAPGAPASPAPHEDDESSPADGPWDSAEDVAEWEQPAAGEQPELVRPFQALAELPEDLAEAFEGLKLAVLRHKTNEWQDIAAADVLAYLDAVKQLVISPA